MEPTISSVEMVVTQYPGSISNIQTFVKQINEIHSPRSHTNDTKLTLKRFSFGIDVALDLDNFGNPKNDNA